MPRQFRLSVRPSVTRVYSQLAAGYCHFGWLVSRVARHHFVRVGSAPRRKLDPARTRPRVVSERLNTSSKFFHHLTFTIILVCRHQWSLRKCDGFTPNRGAKYKGVAIFDKYAAISRKGY